MSSTQYQVKNNFEILICFISMPTVNLTRYKMANIYLIEYDITYHYYPL